MSLDTAWQMVFEFHALNGQPRLNSPALIAEARGRVRAAWMREEIDEFEASRTLEDQADAVIDLIYFALGTLVEMGVRPDELFRIVHVANMAKRTRTGSTLMRDDGKVVKPSGWRDPRKQIREALEQQK